MDNFLYVRQLCQYRQLFILHIITTTITTTTTSSTTAAAAASRVAWRLNGQDVELTIKKSCIQLPAGMLSSDYYTDQTGKLSQYTTNLSGQLSLAFLWSRYVKYQSVWLAGLMLGSFACVK